MKPFLIQRKKKLMILEEATTDTTTVLSMGLMVSRVIQELKIQMVQQVIRILIQMIFSATLTVIFLVIYLEERKKQGKVEKI